jgi:CubicO group peptidase (beta-lactamase class C family)
MLHALVVSVDGEIALERAGPGWELPQPHPLYSGTKSFWGIAAAAAVEDGRLDLDEPLGDTIPEWPRGSARRALTARQLLNLTAGYGFGGLGNAVPTAQGALGIELKHDPGTTFTYGGVPLQVFGEVLRRKLAPDYDSPQAYLRERVLERIAMRVGDWRRLRDGTQPLPTGAFVAAREWLKFGALLLARGAGVIEPESFSQCITGSAINPAYGLGLWLIRRGENTVGYYASGSGGQGLYALPQTRLVAVHFGKSTAWNHAAFLKRLELA